MQRRPQDEPGLGWKDTFLILAIIGLLAATVAFHVAHAAAKPRGQSDLTGVLDHASQLYGKRDYAGARREYERATQMDPGSIQAWRGLGASLWQLGERERAAQVWSDILKVRPDDPDILMELANAEAAQEHWDQAFARERQQSQALAGRSQMMQAKRRSLSL